MNSFHATTTQSLFSKIGISNEEASVLLEESLVDSKSESNNIDIPTRNDGSEYEIKDLAIDQQESLAEILHAVREYCEGRDVHEQKVLRVTVSGVAGSGKSTWINTLVSSVRKIFHNNETISVFAPTGAAAFNAGGETLHRGFGLPFRIQEQKALSGVKLKHILRRFKNTLVIIIDERSMLEAGILGIIKHYMQQYAHQGQKRNHPWGGIPIIILVGDDYQLPSIMPGAFYALSHKKKMEAHKASNSTAKPAFTFRTFGFEEFLEIGKKVIYLEGEKRVINGQDSFKQILRAVRCEHNTVHLSEDNIETLLELDLNHKSFSQKERQSIQQEATYVFANKEPRDRLNNLKLKMENLNENPVARIKSQTTKKSGRQVSNQSHFDADRQPNRVLICINSRVTLNGCNPDPKNGLYHGSLGIVRDIVYNHGTSPNEGNDFPAYVLVEFYQYCGKELIKNMPRYIPIVPITGTCNNHCCSRTYIPLALAYGKTAHTFQGQNVGPVPPGRPENPIKKIIVDPGTRIFESKNVGLFYQLLSRATTIGERNDKLSSAIYFEGGNFSKHRFFNLSMKNEKEMYVMAQLRDDWVQYLRQHELSKGRWTHQQMQHIFDWANNTTINDDELCEIITVKHKQALPDIVQNAVDSAFH